MNFKVGQKVVCVVNIERICEHEKHYAGTIPVKGEINTITDIESAYSDTYLSFAKYPKNVSFRADQFAPIIENTSTADIANQIFETCNDVKEIKIPELV